MLLIKEYIVYHGVFVDGAVVFDRVNFLNLLCDSIFFVSFIKKSFDKFSRVTAVFLECSAYLSNSRCLAVGNTFL